MILTLLVRTPTASLIGEDIHKGRKSGVTFVFFAIIMKAGTLRMALFS